MTTYTFIAKAGTQFVNWSDPTVWAGGVVPNAADADVVFPTITANGGGVFQSVVNINSGETFSTRTIGLTNNVVRVTGSLTASGDVAVHTGGELRVIGGILSAGSLENDGTDVGGSGQIFVSGAFSNGSQLFAANGDLTVSAATLSNTGSFVASSASPVTLTLNVPSGGFTNLSGSTLTGGTYQTGSPFGAFGGTIRLNVGGVIATSAANIALYAGDIFSFDTGTSTYIPLESSLQSILPAGALTLAGHAFNWGNLSVGARWPCQLLPIQTPRSIHRTWP